jgi:hypothetical protein
MSNQNQVFSDDERNIFSKLLAFKDQYVNLSIAGKKAFTKLSKDHNALAPLMNSLQESSAHLKDRLPKVQKLTDQSGKSGHEDLLLRLLVNGLLVHQQGVLEVLQAKTREHRPPYLAHLRAS